ncbi:MAG: hypothetical protein M2R45_03135 [Verrucomicrobia subdivision 3 bacterium]|nr:hypothetical protein [Limisphaerales bacterium]MCS1413203.1 hypothetical protein [Limisphaerales bacterium]
MGPRKRNDTASPRRFWVTRKMIMQMKKSEKASFSPSIYKCPADNSKVESHPKIPQRRDQLMDERDRVAGFQRQPIRQVIAKSVGRRWSLRLSTS